MIKTIAFERVKTENRIIECLGKVVNGVLETVVNSLQDLLGQLIKAMPALVSAVMVLFLTRRLVELVIQIAEKAGKKTLRSTSLQLLLIKISSIGVWTMGVLLSCVLAFPGFDLGDIVATLGIGSVAVGFTFQDIFKNFLAGIILLIEEPFRIGDEVVISGYQGKIEHISIRTTKICTYNGERVLLPNSTVFTDAVRVVTAYDSRRTELVVGVDYNTSLPEAIRLIEQTLKKVSGVMNEPEPEVDVVEFADSSIDLIIRYWTSPQQKQLRQVQTKAMIAIKLALDTANISIPYPIRTLYYCGRPMSSSFLGKGTDDQKKE